MYSMVYQKFTALLTMAAIAPFVFITPERAMMLVGEMYEHSSSPGGGVRPAGARRRGSTWGRSSGSCHTEGLRTLARWSLGVLGLTLALGYGINATCYLPGSEQGHTHIFDIFSRPSGPLEVARIRVTLLSESGRPPPRSSPCRRMAVLVLAGGIVRVWSPRVKRAAWGETVTMDAKEEVAGFWNRSSPTSWLTGSVLVVLVGLAIAGAYVSIRHQRRCSRTSASSALTP